MHSHLGKKQDQILYLYLDNFYFMNMKKYIYLLLVALLFVGCKKDEHEHNKAFTFIVASEKWVSSQAAGEVRVGYWVKYKEDQKWNHFTDGIRDFNHEPGFEYILKVRQIHREGPPLMDIGCCDYTLVEVISKDKRHSEGLEKNEEKINE